jgi:LPS-assembly lipoprotein
MWWSRSLPLAACCVLLAALTACGFRPLYGTPGSGDGATPQLESISLGRVQAAPNSNAFVGQNNAGEQQRTAQLLENDLLDRFSPTGKPLQPRYRLDIQLAESLEAIVVSAQNETTRDSLVMTANYTLVDARTGKAVHLSSTRAIASFDVLRADFGNVAAERDARERLARQLSEQIRAELGSWFLRPAVAGTSGS